MKNYVLKKDGLFSPKGLIIEEDMFNILTDEHKKLFKELPESSSRLQEAAERVARNRGTRSSGRFTSTIRVDSFVSGLMDQVPIPTLEVLDNDDSL